MCNRGKLSGDKGVAMGGRRAERHEGNPNGLERIGGGEGGNRVFYDEVSVDEILELFGGLYGDRSRTSRSVRRISFVAATALGDKRGGVGPSHGENGIRKAKVVGKSRNAQKAIQKVGDRHLPREEVGTDEPGQDVEGEGGTFRGAR